MEWMNLTDICRPKQWKTIAMKDLKEKGYPVYGANGIIGFYDKYTHEEPTVMITCRGATCGTINKSLGKAYINGNAMALDNLKYEIVDMNYLYYYLNNYNFKKVISGSAQPQITRTNLKKVKIPVPPMEIQEKIVRVLDQAQALIDKRKEQIEALDQLIESIFYTMFGDPVRNEKGWEVEELEKVAPIKNHNIDEEIESVWLLNLDMIESNSGVLKEKIYVEIEDLPSSINCFSNKHILYSKLRPYLNKVFIPDDNGYCTSELVPLLPDCKILNREYLLYLLRGRPALHYFNTHTSGARMPRVVMEDLKKMKISVPPLSLQNKFANKVETIEKQKEVLGESLELMEENYKSIMDKAFKGQLFN